MPILDSNKSGGIPFSDQVIEARRFFLGPIKRGSPAIVIGGGFERVGHAYAVARMRVPFVALELVVGGQGMADLDGEKVPLRPGTLFIYGERTPHRLTTSARDPLVKYFLDLNGPRSRPMLRTLALTAGTAWQLPRWLDLARLFDEIIHHGTGSETSRHVVCDALLRALLLHAAHCIAPQQHAGATLDSYQRCCTLIETAFHRIRTLGDLAREASLDEAYVCRLFKKFDRESPYQRLLRKRMSAAATALYAGDRSVQSVAKEFGYTDPFHFSRAFKSVVGTSPSNVRRSHARRAELASPDVRTTAAAARPVPTGRRPQEPAPDATSAGRGRQSPLLRPPR